MKRSRRELPKLASLTAAGMAQAQTQKAVRLAVIGVGGRGNSLIELKRSWRTHSCVQRSHSCERASVHPREQS